MAEQDRQARAPATLAVVGGGPGGYAAAFRAADLGMQVTLVDPEPALGGVCLHRGCIPSKAYLHVAALLDEARHAGTYGIEYAEPRIDRQRLRAWKDEVVSALAGGLDSLAKARRIERVQARAVVRGAQQVELQKLDGDISARTFDFILLATGSRPALPAPLDLDSPRVMSSTDALELESIPQRLLVVGAGYVGLEMATVYAALGSRVSVVEAAAEILPGMDRDLARVLEKKLVPRLESLSVSARITDLSEDSRGVVAHIERPDAAAADERFDAVLVAVGRIPNSSGLGLASTRVAVDKRGFVIVDAARRTAEPSIFAIGDLVGGPMLAHKATHEGIVAAEAMAGHAVAYEPNTVPAVVYTDPEIAWCGMSEKEAKAAGLEAETVRYSWAGSGRARTLGAAEGLTRLTVETRSRRILGAAMAGNGAGELISEAVLAIEMGALAEDVASSIHPHPSLSETFMEAAAAACGVSVHLPPARKRR
ncbi:MAG TPA: dihydrolipoyl dehydrogenase [Candidatus Binatia bacterium]|nr:dihydrolipoyl dehydrogenase [Candidatus Binatia bacterium]